MTKPELNLRDDFKRKALILRVIDGDTVVAQVDLGFHTHRIEHLRLARINAPEKMFHDDWQKAGGFLSTLIEGKEVLIQSMKTEKYGRWLAEIWSLSTGNNINDMMVKSGYAKSV